MGPLAQLVLAAIVAASICSGQVRANAQKPCHPSPCNRHASCTIHAGKARCTCSRGYVGNGYNCTLPDPCHPSPCNAHASCTNHKGRARCICRPGYSGNGQNCTLLDPCHPSHCNANASCTNKEGKPICTCKPGYRGDGHKCTLIDPCSPSPCGPDTSCANKGGVAKCQCKPGFILNGRTCAPQDPCNPSPCDPNASCANEGARAVCTCKPGYRGDGHNCTLIDPCSPSPCGPDASCANKGGVAKCQCKPGFILKGRTCAPQDPCSPSPCDPNASCANEGATAVCTCNPGYLADGHNCTRVDPCSPSPCQRHASCKIRRGAASCQCNPGFIRTGHTCAPLNPCSPDPCGANASCTNFEGTAQCACNLGFSGDGHTCVLLADPCASAPCDANANCYDNFGTAQCTCNGGYTGDGWTCTYVDPCAPWSCSADQGLGTCLDLGGGQSRCDCNATAGASNDGFGSCITDCNDPVCDSSHDCVWLGEGLGVGCWCSAGYDSSVPGYEDGTCDWVDPCVQQPCDPHASCSSVGDAVQCTCNPGFTGDGTICTPTGGPTVGLLLPYGSPVPSKYLNQQTFRYQSSGFSGSPSDPAWTVPPVSDWRTASRVPPVMAQRDCAASWAAATAAAVDAALAIATNTDYAGGPSSGAAAIISVQQLLDCTASTASCSQGGWPLDALDYVAQAAALSGPRLFSEAEYPYLGAPLTSLCAATVQGSLAVVEKSYESASFFGALGIILAVQRQPVIALIEADQPSFIAYNGTYVYDDPGCFDQAAVNHAVVIVGYNLVSDPPYLVIQNSWGTGWGAEGFMNLSITGAPGTCGITSFPVYYPVVQGSDACKPINPCGSGTCTATLGGHGNSCRCPAGFLSSANGDNSTTCILVQVCGTLESNPCGFGTCIDDGKGSYVCICPKGLLPGNANDGSFTCIYDPSFYITGETFGTFFYNTTGLESCYLMANAWGVSVPTFATQNPAAECDSSALMPADVFLVLDFSLSNVCYAYYPIASPQNDTCDSIAAKFGLSINDLQSMNPGLDCTILFPGMQLCVQLASCEYDGPCAGPFLEYCTDWFTPAAGDTCQSVMTRFNLSAADIYSLNPGLYCGHLAPTVATTNGGTATLPVSVCVGGQYFMPCLNEWDCGRHDCHPYYSHYVGEWESCRSIIYHFCYNNPHLFRWLNEGVACSARHPYIGQIVCVAQPSYVQY